MSEQTWKIEEGDVLWRWDPKRYGVPGWVRIGRLEDLAVLAEKLDLPACTVEQALCCAAAGINMDVLAALFPRLALALAKGGNLGINVVRLNAEHEQVSEVRRALALALRALSDRLLEVS